MIISDKCQCESKVLRKQEKIPHQIVQIIKYTPFVRNYGRH